MQAKPLMNATSLVRKEVSWFASVASRITLALAIVLALAGLLMPAQLSSAEKAKKPAKSVAKEDLDWLTDAGRAALEKLLVAQHFQGTCGEGEAVSEELQAYRVLLADPGGDAAFKKLIKEGTIAGKRFGYCGVSATDYTFYEEVGEKLPPEVHGFSHLPGEMDGPARPPERRLKGWKSPNGRREAVVGEFWPGVRSGEPVIVRECPSRRVIGVVGKLVENDDSADVDEIFWSPGGSNVILGAEAYRCYYHELYAITDEGLVHCWLQPDSDAFKEAGRRYDQFVKTHQEEFGGFETEPSGRSGWAFLGWVDNETYRLAFSTSRGTKFGKRVGYRFVLTTRVVNKPGRKPKTKLVKVDYEVGYRPEY